MVNLLPEEFRRQEEREHNATLAEKQQQEGGVMYTQAKGMHTTPPHKGEESVETSRWDVSDNRGVSDKTPPSSTVGKQWGVSTTNKLPAFVQHGAIKKTSLFSGLKKKIRALFKKSSDITPTVHAQPKPQTQALKTIDFGEKGKEEYKKLRLQQEKTKNKKHLLPRMRVNLISEDVLMERSEHIAIIRLGVIAVCCVCVVGAMWFFLQIVVTQKQTRVDQLVSTKDLVEKEVSRIALQTTAGRKVQLRIGAAQALASEHISWLKLLSFFEENTLASVTFDGISLDKNDAYTYSLTATAPSVEDMLAQWQVFEDSAYVESATISGYSREDDTEITSTKSEIAQQEGEEQKPQSAPREHVSFILDLVVKKSLFE
ncbi:MAG: hypothetical protein UV70_C0012G0005 [Parcubacteria group bacterium GW2011_GWA2_43_13]|nr:MAG: hypothetical protein UV70_C0012G0005 [Parcubacteria group bacterium GW2011_GWA2_43_13]HAZ16742.1 hypothetical protein [Candidatus Jacksonbacteria bacterium]